MIQNSDLQFLGAKNYLLSPGIETGRQGWGLFNTTLTSKIPTGSITAGAASITTFAPTSTNPLSGDYSLRVASTGAVTAGHGFISDSFTIDRQDKAKVMGWSFSYEAISGTMDFSGTSNNTWAVYIYDVDGAAWIQPAGVYNLVQSAGVGIASGTFQTTATGTQYRIAVVCITATGGAVEVRFDSFQVSPQKATLGAIPKASTFQTFTSGSGTYTTPTNPAPYMIRVRMVGSGGGGAGAGTAGGSAGGTGGATTFSVLTANGGAGGATAGGAGGAGGTGSLGSGPIGTALTGGSGFGAPTGGLGNAYSSGGAGAGTPFGGGGNPGTTGGAGGAGKTNTGGGGGGGGMSVTAGGNGGAGGGAGGFVDAIITNPATSYSYSVGTAGTAGTAGTSGTAGGAGAAGYIEVEELYISQNVVMSNDTDTRVVAASGYNASSTTVTITATATKITTFGQAVQDTHGSWSTANQEYTIPVSGYYSIFFSLYSDAVATNVQMSAFIYAGATQLAEGTERNFYATASSCNPQTTVIKYLAAGTVITFKGAVNTGTALAGSYTPSAFSIQRLSGPATIAASETVAAKYWATASQTISAATRANYDGKIYDTHNAVTTGASWVFTAPISGRYRTSLWFNNSAGVTGNPYIDLYIDGSAYAGIVPIYGLAGTGTGSSTVYLNAGQTIQIRESGNYPMIGAATISNASRPCYIDIERIGN